MSAVVVLTIFGAALVAMPAAKAQGAAHIYPPIDSAGSDIKAGLELARRTHRRVILDFGGDWCGDCQVLNIYFHQSPNAELLEKNFVLVDINIGHIDANIDVADQYGVPLRKGVPALAVLDERGKVIYAQKGGEFEDMRNMKSSDLTDFLNRWKR
jgi:thiol:disulfide interchange protein